MHSRRLRALERGLISAAILSALSRSSGAQEPMTVTGRVTVGDRPLPGTSVEIPESRLGTRTNASGWYSFLVPADRVRGQNATIVARHTRFGQRKESLALVGGSAIRDFDFGAPAPLDSAVATQPAVEVRPARTIASGERTITSTALGESAGTLDLSSALAGRLSGLRVTSANAPGASSFMVFRGPRTIAGSMQPLVVVDGVPVDGSSASTAAQRFGLGGIDYGSPLQELALEDIAGVSLLSGAEAAARYGARAANGVIEITSTRPAPRSGLTISAMLRSSASSPVRLPAYQNSYGQGLDGRYEFLNGAGAGINDGIDESWGPALNGQLVTQASTTQSHQADVRQWLPHPSAFRSYFRDARTTDGSATIQGAGEAADLRLSLNARAADGVTPDNTLRRLGVTFNSTLRPAARLSLQFGARAIAEQATDRAGTGVDEINPIAGFTRMGRQVDFDVLRQHVVDSAGRQINWIYTSRNNPFAQTVLNSNTDRSVHALGGASLSYVIGHGLTFDLHGGSDAHRQTREVDIGAGWIGGFPTPLGRFDVARGGHQRQTLDVTESAAGADLMLARGSTNAAAVTVTAGGEYRASSFTTRAAVAAAGSQASGSSLDSATFDESRSVTAQHVIAAVTVKNVLNLEAGLRSEIPSLGDRGLYPSAGGSLALFRAGNQPGAATVSIRGGWWRAGNELASRSLADVYAGAAASCRTACARPSAGEPLLGVSALDRPGVEVTEGYEMGPRIAIPGGRMSLDVTGYVERSSNVLVAYTEGAGITHVAQTAALSNRGVEAAMHLIPLRADDAAWTVTVLYSKNVNRVDALAAGAQDVPLGPALYGAALVARTGTPLGTIIGTGYVRDAAGNLLVTKGLPTPTAVPQPLGSWQPDWMGSIENSIRIGHVKLSALVEARVGGRIFSATNLEGSYAGTLAATAFRPDSGFVVHGIDAVTHAPNAVAVSAQSYYHALGAIDEAWVYDAGFVKIRDARISYTVPPSDRAMLRDQNVRITLIGRNLATWARSPNIDPETTLSTTGFQGFEMGQLPSTRSIGVQLSVTP